MIPTGGLFPAAFDTSRNLLEARDALRLTLSEDYTPGDTVIRVHGDPTGVANFPATGLLTLTEQCSAVDLRAVSFFYSSRTATTFAGLEILPGFADGFKPKRITDVTQNVMASYHNNLKDSLVAIEEFVGVKGAVDTKPLGETMEGRVNFLRNLVLAPKAWFKCNATLGIVPLKVTFKNLSFRLGTDGSSTNVEYLWDFGDGDISNMSSASVVSETSFVPSNISGVLIDDLDGGEIVKTYTEPGIYTVKLTVVNDFGTDTAVFDDLIVARVQAPDEATVDITPRINQIITRAGGPPNGPFTTTPVIRALSGGLIDVKVRGGDTGSPVANPSNPGHSYGGEILNPYGVPYDPIESYTWSIADDLPHSHIASTRAAFEVGGVYDLVLRTDTKFGAYRITNYPNCFDIVEGTNLWLWTFTGAPVNGLNPIKAHEFGVMSETFKTASTAAFNLAIDSSFLTGVKNESQQKREFLRNTGFATRGTSNSGSGGLGLLFWATGRAAGAPAGDERIGMAEYNGFSDVYAQHASPVSRPWNWLCLGSTSNAYFYFGGTTVPQIPNHSLTNQTLDAVSTISLTVTSHALDAGYYAGAANELQQNVATYDLDGTPTYGHLGVYRSCWKDNTGFVVRNDGVGPFFRLKSFYRTEGDVTDPVQAFKKLPSMAGPTKVEGQLVALSTGVYFFNNTGAISAYNDTTGTWYTDKGAGVNSAGFRSVQDATVVGFEDAENTLLAASDGNHRAYLSYDYSPRAVVRYNEADQTFRQIGYRPLGRQWDMRIW